MKKITSSRSRRGRRALVALGLTMSVGLAGCGFLDALDKAVKELIAGGIAFDSAGNVDVAGVRVNDFGRAAERYDAVQKGLATTDKNIADFIRNRDGKAVGDVTGPFEEGKNLDARDPRTPAPSTEQTVTVTTDDGGQTSVTAQQLSDATATLEIVDRGYTEADVTGDVPVAGEAVLRGKRVQNKYDFVITVPVSGCGSGGFGCGPSAKAKITVGYAIMEKTAYYDGARVVGADGKDPAPAKVVVDATAAGTTLGYTPLGVVGKTSDAYVQQDGTPAPPGESSHESSATVGLKWEVPLLGTVINIKPQWLQELKVIINKDGTVDCRGDTSCTLVPAF